MCPACCTCPPMNYWEHCPHENDDVCAFHLAERRREEHQNYLDDLRAEWESEVYAAATMDDYLYV